MNYKISIQQTNQNFETSNQENLLDAALAAKINLPHGCKNGACGACKCKIESGSVTHDDYVPSALSAEELAENKILLCKAHATSDVVLDIPGFSSGHPIKTMPSKIESIEKTGTVAILKLKLPANQTFEYDAGQYIDIMYESQNRSYSIANQKDNGGVIELHIRYRKGGVFSEAAWNTLKTGQILRFKGPLGSFKLHDDSSAILFVCTGTGFAPIKAIIEEMIAQKSTRQAHLIWGNFQVDDFYLTELLTQWQEQLNLKVTLCTNQDAPTGYQNGLVTEFIAQNYPDLSNHQIYACGNPAMIENLYNNATNDLKLNKTNFFSDIFTPSK